MTASDVYMIRQFWTDKAGMEHSHYKTALGPNEKWDIVRLVPKLS